MPLVQEIVDDLEGFPEGSFVFLHTTSGVVEIRAIAQGSVPLNGGMQTVILLMADDLPEEDFLNLRDEA